MTLQKKVLAEDICAFKSDLKNSRAEHLLKASDYSVDKLGLCDRPLSMPAVFRRLNTIIVLWEMVLGRTWPLPPACTWTPNWNPSPVRPFPALCWVFLVDTPLTMLSSCLAMNGSIFPPSIPEISFWLCSWLGWRVPLKGMGLLLQTSCLLPLWLTHVPLCWGKYMGTSL